MSETTQDPDRRGKGFIMADATEDEEHLHRVLYPNSGARFSARRIAIGCVFFAGAFFVGSWSVEVLGKPVASFSRLELLGRLAAGAFALALCAWGLLVVFGRGASKADIVAHTVEYRMATGELALAERRRSYDRATQFGRRLGKLIRRSRG